MKTRLFALFLIVFMALSFTIPSQCAELYPDIFLVGHTSLFIPESGKADYSFTVCYMSADGSLIPTDEASMDVSNLPDGITFDVGTGIATIYDYTEEDATFTITVTPPSSQPKLHIKKYTVKATSNLLTNGDFTSYPEGDGWDKRNSSPFTLDKNTLYFNLNETSNATYLLMQNSKLPLDSGILYECSFEIKTHGLTEALEEVSIHSEVIGESAVCYLDNPDFPEWTTVKIPVRCDESGLFIFILAITPEDPALHVSLRNLTFKKTYEQPSSIYTFIPQSFSIPKSESSFFPLDIYVLDQEDNPIVADISYEITPATDGLILSDETITIKSTVIPGSYHVKAYLTRTPDVSTTFTIRITDTGIDNGDFESVTSDESWIASGDGVYSIISENRNSYAAFVPNNSVGVMYNNAFVSFKAHQSYVFISDLKTKYSDSDVYVTFIIEDSEDPENLILCAYFNPDTSWGSYKAVFTPEKDINGRFIVATNIPEGSDDQILYLDNIQVIPAIITAENVKIKGTPTRGNTLHGTFEFINNFDGESASITNWALAPSKEGPYTTLSYSNVSSIEVTEAMEGLYLRFEVTPISLTAGIVGETIYSAPLKISKKHTNVTYEDPDDINPPSVSEEEKPPLKDNPSFISPISIPSGEEIDNPFSDTIGHWAEKNISILSHLGIVEGYPDNTFAPEKQVTRAEFCSLLMKALGLEKGIYSGIYSDVSPESWYAGIVQTMYNCNLISGIDDKNFAPNSPVTREQIVVILMRAYTLIKGESEQADISLHFADIDTISPYAEESIKYACAIGLISGNPEGFFNPSSPATRAEAATLLTRFLEVLEK